MGTEVHDEYVEALKLVDLTPAAAPAARSGTMQPARPRLARRLILMVVLPTVLATVYFGFIAPDRYVSEAKFVLRKPSGLGHAASAAGGFGEGPASFGTDDSYVVRDYMLSRDAMKLLLVKADLRQALERGRSDPLWRLRGFLAGHSEESLYRRYLSLVAVDYKPNSGLSTLTVKAFTPADAQHIADALISGAEALMGRLNDRLRADAIRVARVDADGARDEVAKALDQLTEFRSRQNLVDPTQLSKSVLDPISALSLGEAETTATLDMTAQASPGNPQIVPLRARIAALQAEIERQRKSLGGNDASYAPRIEAYERLSLQRDFAEQNLLAALGLLENARAEAERQQLYLARVVEPNMPDKPRYPHRVAWPLAVFLASLVTYRLSRPAPADSPLA